MYLGTDKEKLRKRIFCDREFVVAWVHRVFYRDKDGAVTVKYSLGGPKKFFNEMDLSRMGMVEIGDFKIPHGSYDSTVAEVDSLDEAKKEVEEVISKKL